MRGWLQRLWPGCCVACGGRCEGEDLCAGCRTELPKNEICCPRCALPLVEPADSCGRCLKKVPAFDQAWVPWRYAQPLDLMLLKLKFGGNLACARVLSSLWGEQLGQQRSGQVDLLIPIPLAVDRLRERGYNQALELARPLARAAGLALAPGALRRIRATEPQSGLDAKARRRNLSGAFAAADAKVRGCRIALIDDVMTTGATLNAAAKALKKAGASEVHAWALARA